MFKVNKKGDIQLTRGDSAYLTINLVDSKKDPYILDPETDDIRVQVRWKYNDDAEQAFLFEGDITDNGDGTATWHIIPQNTNGVDTSIDYYYDVELKIGSDIFTILSADFNLLNEVTLPRKNQQDGD